MFKFKLNTEKICVIILVIIIIITITYIIKHNQTPKIKEKFTNEPPQFEVLSYQIFNNLFQLDPTPPELFNVLKNDLLKLDQLRNVNVKDASYQLNTYLKNNPTVKLDLRNLENYIFFWIQNEILIRYTLELSILLICSVYENYGLIQGDKHQLLLKEKMDAFVYFIMNSLIYIFYIRNIENASPSILNLEINNFAFQLHMIRKEKLKLISSNINNHYDILNNTPIDYQNSSKLLIQACQIPPKNSTQITPPEFRCEYAGFSNTIIEFMKQILDNPTNEAPVAFSTIIPDKDPETVTSLDKDYFGNP